MLTEFIIEQIKSNNRIIIPDFGAVLSRQNPNGIITYSFSPFLKYNDGVIVNYLANKNNLSKDDALAQIKEYINKLKSEIKQKGDFTFFGIGKLVDDGKGNFKMIGETEKTVKQPEPKTPTKETTKE